MNNRLPIYIPSRSRWTRCLTLEQLGHAALRRPVYFVVPHEQRDKYIRLSASNTATYGCRIPVLSDPKVKGIAATRQFIGQHAALVGMHPKFIMLDDDLRFCHRTATTDLKLLNNTPADNVRMLADVERALDTFAHAGISPRQFNNAMKPVQDEFSVRIIRALAFRTVEFNRCTHGRVDIMEDFDVTLQLLAKGYPNRQFIEWTQDQSQTQATGGCSDYRTHALHERNVRKMAKLWEDVVKLRWKQNKTGGEFGKRLELTVYWKKALGLYERQLV